MKTLVFKYTPQIFLAALLLMFIAQGCERSVDGLDEPTFSEESRIFTDTFIQMGENFYFPFDGARPDVFSVDEDEGYQSSSSIRIDVPNSNDPAGNYAGAIFREDGAGRNLTQYNALTFYAKTSQDFLAIKEFEIAADLAQNLQNFDEFENLKNSEKNEKTLEKNEKTLKKFETFELELTGINM